MSAEQKIDTIQSVKIEAADGFVLNGKLYLADTSNRYLLIGSAFGVPNSYYRHFASYMATQGINVLSFDYRGVGDSQIGSVEFEAMQLQDWAEKDIEAAINYLKQERKAETLYYLGHSYGGQVVGLAPSSTQIDKIMLVATGIGHWRLWPGLYKIGMFLVWKLLFPVSMLFRRKRLFSSYLLGKVPIPRNLVQDWLRWARSDNYLFTPIHGLDLSGYDKLTQPKLALNISDDRYAPIKSLEALITHYPKENFAPLIRITPKSIGLKSVGHFGLFKKKQEIEQGIWQPILNFFNEQYYERTS